MTERGPETPTFDRENTWDACLETIEEFYEKGLTDGLALKLGHPRRDSHHGSPRVTGGVEDRLHVSCHGAPLGSVNRFDDDVENTDGDRGCQLGRVLRPLLVSPWIRCRAGIEIVPGPVIEGCQGRDTFHLDSFPCFPFPGCRFTR